MPPLSPPTVASWLTQAEKFSAAKNWIGALSSVRNALRLDVKNLVAWHWGCEILIQQDRQYAARSFARALKRFAHAAGNRDEAEYAETQLAQIQKYYDTLHLRNGETDLTHFAARGDSEKVKELLAAGADPNGRNRSGWTPLHCVRGPEAAGIGQLLIAHGADIEAEDQIQETPLIHACSYGRLELVPVLLAAGANVSHTAKERHTALWYAIYSQKNPDLVKQLIAAGADPNEEYVYGNNPFLLAVTAQNPAIVNYLLPLTHDVARVNQHGVTALHFAASYNDCDLLQKLLARGVDVNMTVAGNMTALMDAAANDAVAATRVLLAHGARQDMESEYHGTAETIARERKKSRVLELLTGKKDDSGGN